MSGSTVEPGDHDRIQELEAIVARQRDEIGDLRIQLDVLSTTDLVTGLPNLHGMLEVVDSAVQRHNRSGEPFGLLSIQLPGLADNESGELDKEALRHTGALAASALRRMDRVGRTEGAGFLVALPGATIGGVESVSARVIRVVSSVPLGDDTERRFSPRIAGVAVDRPTVVETADIIDRLYALRDRPGPRPIVERV